MKSTAVLSTLLGSGALAFLGLSTDFKEEHLRRGLDIIKRDFELSALINDLCDFYLCNGDNHNLNKDVFMNLKDKAMPIGNGQYNVKAVTAHFADQYQNSRAKKHYLYFFSPLAALVIGATYFSPGFFPNGSIGAGGVANEASIASFLGASFNDDGSFKAYVPEQIPPQG
ncbi:hypothetical protein E8E12_009029 [Didymella heteroderae]|uniref:Uncharacterized protein n=1 Tax=Didymella heteroderae TaxID=1769908 RepID=A0A9P4WW28_9PLEO|nr:hypothetical protein E8E12_009029 [Didymella heteroderae]